MEISILKSKSLVFFPLQTKDKVRYGDTDRQGHVNNAIFSQFFETGRVELLYHPDRPLYATGCSFVIVSSKVDFIREIVWPGMVDIGTVVLRLGNSSVTFGQVIFQNEKLVATCESVIVQVENGTSLSKPLSPETKNVLEKYVIFPLQ